MGRTPSHGLLERIQIDAHQIDRLAADAAEGIAVGIGVTHEHSSVHSRMKRLHAAVHDLGRIGVFGDVDHVDAALTKGAGRASRREDLCTRIGEPAGEIDDAILVGY